MRHRLIRITIAALLVLLFAACSYESEPALETGAVTATDDTEYNPANTPTPSPDENYTPSPTPYPYEPAQTTHLPNKIAIIAPDHITQQQWSWVAEIAEHYGPQNTIIHPWAGSSEIAQIANEIIGNPDIRLLLINPAGTEADQIAAEIRNQRDDIFIILHDPDSSGILSTTAENANLFLRINEEEMVRAFPTKARKLGASVIAYFYDTQTWCDLTVWEESPLHALMREASAQAGLLFIETDVYGQMQCGSSTHEYMSEVIPPLLEEHGPDIVFVGMCNWRLWSWVNNNGAIYLPLLQTWFTPDPIHIAGEAAFILDSNVHQVDGIYDVPLVISDIRHHLNEAGQLGRAATFPIAPRILFSLASIEYGMRWVHGDVPEYGIDMAILEQIMLNIITQFTGEHVDIGLSYINESHLLVSMGYLVF